MVFGRTLGHVGAVVLACAVEKVSTSHQAGWFLLSHLQVGAAHSFWVLLATRGSAWPYPQLSH